MQKNKTTIALLNKLKKLSKGTYTKTVDGKILKICVDGNIDFKYISVSINDNLILTTEYVENENKENIKIYFNSNEKSYYLNLNKEYPYSKFYPTIIIKNDENNNIVVTKDSVSMFNNYYYKYGNTLCNKLNDSCYLGYDLDESIFVIFFQKYNIEDKKSTDFKNEYIKVPFGEDIIYDIQRANKRIEESISQIIDTTKNVYIKELLNTITLPKIEDKIDISELLKAKSYFEYFQERLDNYSIDSVDIIDTFADELILDPILAEYNAFKNLVINADLNDVTNLKEIQKKLLSIIKVKKVLKKTKK